MYRFTRNSILSCFMVLIFLFPTSSFASSSNAEKDLNEQLIQRGAPADAVESWSPELKKRLTSTTTGDITYEKVSGPKPEGEKVSPSATIPTSQFDFYITIFDGGVGTNGHEQRTVVLTSKWLPEQMPKWRLTDAYGASFDRLKFRLSGTPLYEDRYTWYTSKDTWRTLNTGYAFAYTAENGAGFNADVKGDNIGLPLYVYKQTSSATFNIEAKDAGSVSGSSQVQANYYHTLGVGSVGLSFGPMSVSFSGFAPVDSRGAYKTFNY